MSAEEERTAFLLAMRYAHCYLRAHPRLNVSREDVLSDAAYGAAKALKHYDPAKGATWANWLHARVHCEILDGVRSRSPLTRGQVRRGLVPQDRPEQLGAAPLIQGLAARIPDPRASAEFAHVDDCDHVERLLAALPERLAFVVREVDLHGHPLATVGRALGVTDSRVCQLRREALKLLRAA